MSDSILINTVLNLLHTATELIADFNMEDNWEKLNRMQVTIEVYYHSARNIASQCVDITNMRMLHDHEMDENIRKFLRHTGK